jgi:hypothetical protein
MRSVPKLPIQAEKEQEFDCVDVVFKVRSVVNCLWLREIRAEVCD